MATGSTMPQLQSYPRSHPVALLSGAFAGMFVDITLYPLDTIKTRLQSQQGFKAAGGLSKIYAGIPAIAVGSAPSAALFFFSYEKAKRSLEKIVPHPTYSHMAAACIGELTACLIRVPTEVFKQRAQAAPGIKTSRLVTSALANDGLTAFYRGYWSTVSRELPFSFIEFPLWEYFKRIWSQKQEKRVSPFQTAVCGSVAGSIAAGLTTPLDLAKTRIMLTRKITGEKMTIKSVLMDVYRIHGYKGIFAGFWPRVIWMGLGGFVFFGVYDVAVRFFNNAFMPDSEPIEHFNMLAVKYWVTSKVLTTIDYLLFDEENLKKIKSRTFEDALNEAAESEEMRRQYIEAARKKFGGKEQI